MLLLVRFQESQFTHSTCEKSIDEFTCTNHIFSKLQLLLLNPLYKKVLMDLVFNTGLQNKNTMLHNKKY